MCLLKILKESWEELVRDFNPTAFQPAHPSPFSISSLHLLIKCSLAATNTNGPCHRKHRVKWLHFPNLNLPRRGIIVKIPHLLLKDCRERAVQEPHTALAKSDEGRRLGRLLVISGHRKAGWQLYLLYTALSVAGGKASPWHICRSLPGRSRQASFSSKERFLLQPKRTWRPSFFNQEPVWGRTQQ